MPFSFHPRRAALTAAATLITSAALLACSDGGSANAPAGTGTVRLQLTDAPFPFDSVARADIFVVRIDAKTAETDSGDASRRCGDDDLHGDRDATRDWVTLATPNQTVNLLDLQNGTVMNLGQPTLPTGTYRGFRLIIDPSKSSITLKDGTVLTGNSTPGIKFPSADRTGIKIDLTAPVQVTSGETILVIDFDLGRSFHVRGNSFSRNGFIFRPVVRATARNVAGAIRGSVHADSANGAAVANATVEVLSFGTALDDTVAANVIATAQTDSAGNYLEAFLPPGIYAVRATPPSGSTHHAAIVPSVTVGADAITSGITIVLP